MMKPYRNDDVFVYLMFSTLCVFTTGFVMGRSRQKQKRNGVFSHRASYGTSEWGDLAPGFQEDLEDMLEIAANKDDVDTVEWLLVDCKVPLDGAFERFLRRALASDLVVYHRLVAAGFNRKLAR